MSTYIWKYQWPENTAGCTLMARVQGRSTCPTRLQWSCTRTKGWGSWSIPVRCSWVSKLYYRILNQEISDQLCERYDPAKFTVPCKQFWLILFLCLHEFNIPGLLHWGIAPSERFRPPRRRCRSGGRRTYSRCKTEADLCVGEIMSKMKLYAIKYK